MECTIRNDLPILGMANNYIYFGKKNNSRSQINCTRTGTLSSNDVKNHYLNPFYAEYQVKKME